MGKVYALHQGFIGTDDGVGIDLIKNKVYDTDSREYQAAPSLFAPVEGDTSTELAALKAQVAELLAAQAKTPAKKATAAELKADVK